MIFKYCSKTHKITLPNGEKILCENENIIEYFQSFKIQPKYENRTIEAIGYEDSKIKYGYFVANPDTKDSVFKEEFYLDLKDYKVKRPDGSKLNIELVTKQISLNLVLIPGAPTWIEYFHQFLHKQAYSNTTRTKGMYFLSIFERKSSRLVVVEKLYKLGLLLNRSDMLQFIEKFSPKDLEQPHLGMNKKVFNLICKNLNFIPSYFWNSELRGMLNSTVMLYFAEFFLDNEELLETVDVKLGIDKYSLNTIQELITDLSYDKNRLIEYLFVDLVQKQGIPLSGIFPSIIESLRDYASSCIAVYGAVREKYPKYLKSEHDIVVAKLNTMQKALENENFMHAYDSVDFNWTGENGYIVSQPTEAFDLIDEGKNLKHCVASYVSRVSNSEGADLIVFLRKEVDFHTIPLLTIEIEDKTTVVQVRGLCNRDPRAEEWNVLTSWCKDKNLHLSETLQKMCDKAIKEGEAVCA